MKRITLRDVAEHAGVSTAVVSYVINGGPRPTSAAVREKVLRSIEELDYHPDNAARGLRGKRTRTIAFVTYDFTPNESFSSHYLGRMITALTREFQRLEHYVLMFPIAIGADPVPLRRMLKSGRVDGVALRFVQDTPDTDDLLTLVTETGTRCVCLERPGDERFAFPAVTYDDSEGSRLAMEHLISLGHQRIAHLHGDLRYSTARARITAYRQSLRDAGIPFDAALEIGANWSTSLASHATRSLLTQANRPTALFCASDDMAIGALHAARDLGCRVPDDLAVIGFDDIPLASDLTPMLTTVRAPLDAMGVQAAQRLAMPEEFDGAPLIETLPVELVQRETA